MVVLRGRPLLRGRRRTTVPFAPVTSARALLEGRRSVAAVQFAVQPEPDHRNCRPNELPYD